MIFDVTHRTTLSYARSVSISHHLLHLSPRSSPCQTCRRHFVMVEPPPTLMTDAVDYFGNTTTYLTIEDPHKELSITARSNVEVIAPPLRDPAATSAWDSIAAILDNSTDRVHLDVFQFLFESPFTRSGDKVAGYAAASFPPGRPVLEAALDLMNRIYDDFSYEGGVTDIYTPVDDVLAQRSGVCQDFAHLFISALRQLRIPARYVSGYLMTRPPEGQPRLIGADASHAWLSIWMPELGWVDLDPTNNVLPADEHITVAWGRDYGDVSPVSGMVLGGGAQKLAVAVDVAPVGA